jgi:hypothetical protein
VKRKDPIYEPCKAKHSVSKHVCQLIKGHMGQHMSMKARTLKLWGMAIHQI